MPYIEPNHATNEPLPVNPQLLSRTYTMATRHDGFGEKPFSSYVTCREEYSDKRVFEFVASFERHATRGKAYRYACSMLLHFNKRAVHRTADL